MSLLLAAIALLVSIAAHLGAGAAARAAVLRRALAKGQLGPATRALSALAAIAATYALTVLLWSSARLAAGGWETDEASMRVDVAAGGPAAEAGLRAGDRVVSVGGAPVSDWLSLKARVAASAGRPLDVEIARDGEPSTRHVVVTPDRYGKMHVTPPTRHVDVGVGRALAEGVVGPVKVLGTAASTFARALTGGDKTDVSGPAGIVRETSNVGATMGWAAELLPVAFISAYLFPGFVVCWVIVAWLDRFKRGARGPAASAAAARPPE